VNPFGMVPRPTPSAVRGGM